jgi:hypothetical protein
MNNILPEFAKFLAGCWEEAPEHSYRLPTKGLLSRWPDFNSQWDGDRQVWTARSLSEALEKYFWPPNGNFANNRQRLNELRDSLSKAIQERNDRLAESVVCEIFEWGGAVRRPDGSSRLWVRDQARKGALCGELAEAVQLLKANNAPLDRFGNRSLLMNLSLTKVYALADPEQFLIIYDGPRGGRSGTPRKVLSNSTRRTHGA